jgi:hypothetical protein
MFQMNQLNSFVRLNVLRHSSPPFQTSRRQYFMGYVGLVKVLRRCFAEAAWLYQNASRKATIISDD